MARLPQLALDMPVLVRDLRARMRGLRAFLVMASYVALLGLAAVGALALVPTSGRAGLGVFAPLAGPQDSTTLVGREIFLVLALGQLGLIVLISPGLTAGAISGEHEQRTLETLALTRLSHANLVVGKLLGSLCYGGLLLVCGLPVFALTLMLGGVSPLEIALVDALTAGVGLLFGSLGLLASALVPRTAIATVLAYGATAVLAIGLPLSVASSAALVLVGGLFLAALLTGIARWGIPHYRPNWRPERVHYIGLFGLSYCAMMAVFYTSWVDRAQHFLLNQFGGLDPVRLLAAGAAMPALILIALTLLGATAALIGAASLVRVMRAPQPDSFETVVRRERELSLARREAAL